MRPTPKYAELGRGRVYYEEAGSHGEPLVLIHGLSGSGRWWRRNVPELANHHRVYAVDLFGFGGSRAVDGGFVLAEAASVLAEWMDYVGLARASVVGHSMGGLVAAELAARHPARVEKLVLVNAAALPLGRRYLRHAMGLIGFVRQASLGFYPVVLVDALRAGPVSVLGAAHQLLRADPTDTVRRIGVPTLIVWGRDDPLVPLELGERLVGLIAGSQLAVLNRAGHNPMWDRPDEFNALVLRFLGSGGTSDQPGNLRMP